MGQKLKPPAKTPEARENQCINMAMNLAAERLAEGTASSQIICHFLKAGALKTQYELEKLRSETASKLLSMLFKVFNTYF